MLEQYRIFYEVAEAKSFSAAAEKLYITQPAVSQAVGKLETELGARLFVRGPRGVTLTGAGELLLSYVGRALSIIDSVEDRFFELRSLERGTLAIGASDTMCRYFLLPYLTEFHTQYPKIKIKVTNRTSAETIELLKNGSVDLGFVNLPVRAGGDLAVLELFSVQDCFVCGRTYYDALSRTLTPEELAGQILLMLERQSASRRYLDQYFEAQGVDLSPQIELGSLDLLLEFARSGLGVAAVAEEYAAELVRAGELRVIPLEPPIPPRSAGLVYHQKIPLTFAAQKFLGLMEKGLPSALTRR